MKTYMIKQVLTGCSWHILTAIIILLSSNISYAATVTKQADSDFHSGIKYLHGNGVKRDVNRAFNFFKKAAEQNHPEALYYLGLMYEVGEGVTKNYDQAYYYFTEAAELGHSDAKYEQGKLYLNKEWSEYKPYEGMMILTLCADEDKNTSAMVLLGSIYSKGELEKDDKIAVAYYKEAAELGNVLGMFNLAKKYLNGEGVEQDPNTAFSWYLKAADLGDAPSQYNVGYMYLNGIGTIPDKKKAIKYLKKAANQGHENADMLLFKLGK